MNLSVIFKQPTSVIAVGNVIDKKYISKEDNFGEYLPYMKSILRIYKKGIDTLERVPSSEGNTIIPFEWSRNPSSKILEEMKEWSPTLFLRAQGDEEFRVDIVFASESL